FVTVPVSAQIYTLSLHDALPIYEQVAEKAKEIEGKFKVIRAEFGAVTMSLRDIIFQHLEKGLERMGIDYTFPPADQVTNNKDMLDRKSTRLNSSHVSISYAVFCL